VGGWLNWRLNSEEQVSLRESCSEPAVMEDEYDMTGDRAWTSIYGCVCFMAFHGDWAVVQASFDGYSPYLDT
jgi:hypothetical protein